MIAQLASENVSLLGRIIRRSSSCDEIINKTHLAMHKLLVNLIVEYLNMHDKALK
mgnify:CR=1 FL=1